MADKIIDFETSRLTISENTGLIVAVDCFEKAVVDKPDIDDIKDTGLEVGTEIVEKTPQEKAVFDAA